GGRQPQGHPRERGAAARRGGALPGVAPRLVRARRTSDRRQDPRRAPVHRHAAAVLGGGNRKGPRRGAPAPAGDLVGPFHGEGGGRIAHAGRATLTTRARDEYDRARPAAAQGTEATMIAAALLRRLRALASDEAATSDVEYVLLTALIVV